MQRFACLCFCCVLPLCVHAQGIRKDANAAAGTKVNSATASTGASAKAMVGDNIVALFRAVQASGSAGAKSEFESTAQYEARLASWKGGTKKYVFVLDKEEQSPLDAYYTFEYDADAEEMHLTVGSNYLAGDTIQLRSIRTVIGTYVGTNAFGVKKTITRIVEYSYYVNLSSSSPFKLFSKDEYGISFEPAKFAWTMDPVAARASKAALRIAVVGAVPSPEATEETRLTEPTTSRPREVLVYSRTLPFSLEELRVLNSRTGATVASFGLPSKGETFRTEKAGPAPVVGAAGSELQPTTKPAARDLSSQPRPEPSQPDGTYPIGGGASEPPKLLSKVEPEYSPEARKAKYQGTVLLYATIGVDGIPRDIMVVHSLGLGLDEKAVECVSKWRFKPGTRDGKPVPGTVTHEVNFRLL